MNSSDYRRIARENLAGRWGEAILVALLASMLGGLIAGGLNAQLTVNENESIHFSVQYGSFIRVGYIGLLQFILGGVVRQGYAVYLLKEYDRREKPEVRDLFSQFHRFGDGFCLMLLQTLFVLLWSLLLIVPGLIASLRYAMAPFIMAENPDMTALEAINASKELMEGHKMELFLLGLSFFGWALLCILTLGIGSLWLNPYINAAHAAFYRHISRPQIVDAL